MQLSANNQSHILNDGFAIIRDVYTQTEVASILGLLSSIDSQNSTFRKHKDLFAIRQFFREVPSALPLVFNSNLKAIITQLFGSDYFIVKSIYFDKPPSSNWFVAYHQDLTISVDQKADVPGFHSWTVKQNQFSVQPVLSILENNFTIRVHLDDTTESNGALKVIPASHRQGICRPELLVQTMESQSVCAVEKGGVMIMKPLLLHASSRTTDNQRRRVIHIEFSNASLPGDLNWSEKLVWN